MFNLERFIEMRDLMKERQSERGEAGAKLLFIVVLLFLAGHAGYNFIPVAYHAENFKQEMHSAVIKGMSLPPVGVTPMDHVKNNVMRAARENDLPADAFIQVKTNKGVIEVYVSYVKKVPILPFGLYDYSYTFEHSASPSGYLMKT